ncbi:hypothetical protein MMC12_004329 [Toensbergia leucococca]|nr:hypothetical protein [Toensbergia leucococca]
MEAIGAAAPLQQLIESALSVARTSQRLKSYKAASNELKAVEFQVTFIQALTDEFKKLETEFDSGTSQDILPVGPRSALAGSLEETSGAFRALRSTSECCQDRPTVSDRLQWALLRK